MPSSEELLTVLHDLRVHQIELEMQNEELRRTRDALDVARARYADLYDLAPVGYLTLDGDGFIREANLRSAELLGSVRSALLEGPFSRFVMPDDQGAYFQMRRQLADAGTTLVREFRLHRGPAETFWARMEISTLLGAEGHAEHRVALSDITGEVEAATERESLRAELAQAQRLESVGLLAGGVAHDFNNMLCAILGYVGMALMKVDENDPLHEDLIEIQRAAERSAALTRQLLAFARKQVIAPVVLDLDATAAGLLTMLRRLIGEDITLDWRPGSGAWRIKLDPSQVDQVLASLCVNAREAIGGAGHITIETSQAVLDEAYCAGHPGASVGEHLGLSVTDNGAGIDADVMPHVFEPFFTTKAFGGGSGLGLATVYGIVKQNAGFIDVRSTPGVGTTFSIYFPRYIGEVAPVAPPSVVRTRAGDDKTIMVVEDEPLLREVTGRALVRLGYRVLTAGTPGEALRLAASHPDAIQLLLADVVLPQMNGRELANHLLTLHPELTCVFMSGHTADVVAQRGVLDEGTHFIRKPFSLSALAAKVQDLLR